MAMYLRLTIEEVDEERNVVGLRAAVVFGAHQRSRTPPTKAGGQGTGPSLIGVQATGQSSRPGWAGCWNPGSRAAPLAGCLHKLGQRLSCCPWSWHPQ
jgi:hypothetical protein